MTKKKKKYEGEFSPTFDYEKLKMKKSSPLRKNFEDAGGYSNVPSILHDSEQLKGMSKFAKGFDKKQKEKDIKKKALKKLSKKSYKDKV